MTLSSAAGWSFPGLESGGLLRSTGCLLVGRLKTGYKKLRIVPLSQVSNVRHGGATTRWRLLIFFGVVKHCKLRMTSFLFFKMNG